MKMEKEHTSHSHQDHRHDHDHCHGHHCHHHHDHDHHHNHGEGSDESLAKRFAPEILSLILMVLALILLPGHESGNSWIRLTAYILAVIPVALPILKSTFKEWSRGDVFNEFTLMVMASIGAFLIGEYPEAVAVLLFYSIGEKLEDVVSGNVTAQIGKLLGKMPKEAILVTDTGEKSVKPESVEPGMIISVKPGEAVPLDGVIISDADVDVNTSAITGESLPRTYTNGSEINSGMIPINRGVKVKVTSRYNDSSLTKIMRMIEDASKNRAPSETMLRKITRWYTPAVFAMAILIFFIPWLVGLFNQGFDFEWQDWFRRSLVFLVCACPCALVVSIPLTYFAAIGVSSKKGMLFKGHNYLDALRDIDTVYLDKTGTVTTGKFHVEKVTPMTTLSADQVVEYAASVERESSHPLATAIVEYADMNGLKLPESKDVETMDHGMSAEIDAHTVLVGSRKFMQTHSVDFPNIDGSGSRVYVAIDSIAAGVIDLADTLKPGVKEAVDELHRLGVKNVSILSGDLEQAVAKVSDEVGADSYKAELLPGDKNKYVSDTISRHHKVAFAGDGVNDAPSLAASNVGIAMGSLGSDMAIESAGVVIATDDLRKISEGIRISRLSKHVILENTVFAFGVKILIMSLGAFGIASLWAAVFADTGVTLITILWTLYRLKIWQLKK